MKHSSSHATSLPMFGREEARWETSAEGGTFETRTWISIPHLIPFFDFEKRHAFNDGSDLVDEEPTKVHNIMKHRGVLAHRVAAKDSPLQTIANVRGHVVRQTVGRLAWNSQQAPNQHLLPRPAASQILWSSRARVPELRCPNCDFSCFAEIGPRWTEGGQ